MKTIGLLMCAAMVWAGPVWANSEIIYTLELGGDNRADLWEAAETALFRTDVVRNRGTFCADEDLTWGVRLRAEGFHYDQGGPGDGKRTLGVAYLAFDLELQDVEGNPIAIGAAPMVCAAGDPGEPDALSCEPAGPGFWSSINDGDADGLRGQVTGPDPFAPAAFAVSLAPDAGQGSRLIDPNPGPNFDAFSYPVATGSGSLVGFEAGYADFDFGVLDRAGVGVYGISLGTCGTGLGENLTIIEGQIHGLPPGIYRLVLTPAAGGNEILHGDVDCAAQTFGGWDVFSAPANQVSGDSILFEVVACDEAPRVVGRYLFYNGSYYDDNNSAINLGPNGGTSHDHDDDAIDPTKYPLRPGYGLAEAANWSGSVQGITGLMFDVAGAARTITAGDFSFTNLGKAGAGSAPVAPADFYVRPGVGVNGSDRVVVTFQPYKVYNTWLEVQIGTGFGLPAPDVCWWGNARYDCGTAEGLYIVVNATDILGPRDHPRLVPGSAPVDDIYDYNKNGRVETTDILGARDNTTNPLTAPRRIAR